MNNIPSFDDAVASFQHFLTEQGHPSKILWVFRDDIWKRSSSDVVLRFPFQIRNLALAKKVFAEGRKNGLVDVQAVATVDDMTAATVWSPKFTDEEIEGWNRGMKLSIAQPLPEAKPVGGLMWLWFRLHPRFRQYQRREFGVGTKAWAHRS
jgi:alpha/beta hydrolase family protein